MNWIFQCLAGALSGILGAMGLGGGGVLIIYLTLFLGIEQAKAQGMNLIFFVPIAILAVIMYLRKGLIIWKIACLAAILGIIGAWVGTYISSFFDNNILSKIFGGLLFVMGIFQTFGKYKENDT